MSWKKKKIGKLCSITKGKIGISKAISGKYPLVVTSEERKSHNEFHFEGEAVVIPLVSSTGHGHRSLKRIHYQTGKFAVGSILCALIPNDDKILNTEYLYRFLDLNREKELVSRMRGMANVTLPMKEIANIEVPLPPLDEQIKFVSEYKKLETANNTLSTEITYQLDLVKQLRQSFLREAMQGKFLKSSLPLKEEYPKGEQLETGAELLAKIKAEKAIRQAQGTLKKQKPLPPITKEKIPFEIPKNWVWCRLNEASINRDGERIPVSQAERQRKDKIFDYYGASGVIDKIDNYTHNGKFVLIGEDGANLIAKSTPIAFIAEGKFWVNNHAHILELLEDTTIHFMTYCLNIIDITPFITGGFQPKLSQGNLNKMPIPLPPLSEQKRIVTKLDELMAYCDSLEESIKNSQGQNDMLLQQVLREALEPASDNSSAGKPKEKEFVV